MNLINNVSQYVPSLQDLKAAIPTISAGKIIGHISANKKSYAALATTALFSVAFYQHRVALSLMLLLATAFVSLAFKFCVFLGENIGAGVKYLVMMSKDALKEMFKEAIKREVSSVFNRDNLVNLPTNLSPKPFGDFVKREVQEQPANNVAVPTTPEVGMKKVELGMKQVGLGVAAGFAAGGLVQELVQGKNSVETPAAAAILAFSPAPVQMIGGIALAAAAALTSSNWNTGVKSVEDFRQELRDQDAVGITNKAFTISAAAITTYNMSGSKKLAAVVGTVVTAVAVVTHFKGRQHKQDEEEQIAKKTVEKIEDKKQEIKRDEGLKILMDIKTKPFTMQDIAILPPQQSIASDVKVLKERIQQEVITPTTPAISTQPSAPTATASTPMTDADFKQRYAGIFVKGNKPDATPSPVTPGAARFPSTTKAYGNAFQKFCKPGSTPVNNPNSGKKSDLTGFDGSSQPEDFR